MKKTWTALAFGAIVSSCASSISSDEFPHWVDNQRNGLISSTSSDSIFISAKFLPFEFRNIRAGGVLVDDSSSVFLVTIKSESNLFVGGETNSDTVFSLQQYFSFNFEDDIFLVDNDNPSDTIRCNFFHFEQTNRSKVRQFLVGFPAIVGRTGERLDANIVFKSQYLSSQPLVVAFYSKRIPIISTDNS